MKTIISLQQDFLPTDTVVDIPAILQDYPDQSTLLNWIGWGAIALALLCVIIFYVEEADSEPSADGGKKRRINLPYLFIALGYLSVIVGVTAIIYNTLHTKSEVREFYEVERSYNKQVEEQSAQNRENLFANIEAVYDIESIEITPDTVEMLTRADVGWVAGAGVLEPPRFDSVNAVVFQDGRTFNVSLKQNPDTYEPTLFVDSSDTPIRKK